MSAYSDSVVASSPSIYLPLTDASGATSAVNLADGANPGVLTGSVTPGVNAGLPALTGETAFSFAPSSQVGLTDDSPLPSGNAPFTAEVWLNFAGTGSGFWTPFYWGDIGTAGGNVLPRLFDDTTLDVQFTSNGSDLNVGGLASLFGVWTHVAITWDGTNRALWINGVQVGADVPGGAQAMAAINFALGTLPGIGQDFEGDIAHFALYPSVLSGSALLSHYLLGTSIATGLPVDADYARITLGGTDHVTIPLGGADYASIPLGGVDYARIKGDT